MSKSFQILMVLLLAFLPTLSKAENVSELPIVITSFDRIVSEKRIRIKENEVFFACVDELVFSQPDVLTGERKFEHFQILHRESGKTLLLYVEHLVDLPESDPNIPSVGDCGAFKSPVANYINYSFNPVGFIVVTKFERPFLVDEIAEKSELKKQLTATEFFEQGVDYGLKQIELTGNVYKTDYNKRWFKIVLYSNNFKGLDDKINAYYDSKKWKDNDVVKKQLLSLKQGGRATVKGFFGGPNVLNYHHGFEVIEIID